MLRVVPEGQGAAFHLFTCHLGASVVLVLFFGLVVGFVFVGFCLLGLHLGFLHGICLEPIIGLLLH